VGGGGGGRGRGRGARARVAGLRHLVLAQGARRDLVRVRVRVRVRGRGKGRGRGRVGVAGRDHRRVLQAELATRLEEHVGREVGLVRARVRVRVRVRARARVRVRVPNREARVLEGEAVRVGRGGAGTVERQHPHLRVGLG